MILKNSNACKQVARHLFGQYINGDYRELIQIEYRYAIDIDFTLHTRIQSDDYQIQSSSFFDAISMLLDQLPTTSSLMIEHRVILSCNGADEITTLEEHLFPFQVKDSGTVTYKLRLKINESYIETHQHHDFGSVAEDLRKQLIPHYQLKICYYCQYLIEYNEYGGTDYRHDQLYCFRDKPQILDKLMKTYPKLSTTLETLLGNGLPDVDSMHSCSSYLYRPIPRT